jgi:predicted transcriptional regulator
VTRHRTDTEREADRRAISEYYLKGWNQTDIANLLNIDQSTVSRDIKHLKGEWVKQRNGLVDEFEAKYRHIYREALAAWEESKKPAETETSEMVEVPEVTKDERGNAVITMAQRLKASTRKEGQSGNPALLAQAQAALKSLREMFGTDAKNDPGSSEDRPFIAKIIKEIVVNRESVDDSE